MDSKMNIKDKRKIVDLYCNSTECQACVLVDKEWGNSWPSSRCLCINQATEAELDTALLFIDEERKRVDQLTAKNERYWSRVCEMQKKTDRKGSH